MKHLEIIHCKPRRFQTPFFTTEAWLKIAAWFFVIGLSAGILLGSWWNSMLWQAANR